MIYQICFVEDNLDLAHRGLQVNPMINSPDDLPDLLCWGQSWSWPRGLQVNPMINSPDDLPDLLNWGQSWSCPRGLQVNPMINSPDDLPDLLCWGQSWSRPCGKSFKWSTHLMTYRSAFLKTILMLLLGATKSIHDQLTCLPDPLCWGQSWSRSWGLQFNPMMNSPDDLPDLLCWSCPRGLQVNPMINSPDDLPDPLCWGQSWSCPRVPWVLLCSSWTRL
jgi:hypothetical protein